MEYLYPLLFIIYTLCRMIVAVSNQLFVFVHNKQLVYTFVKFPTLDYQQMNSSSAIEPFRWNATLTFPKLLLTRFSLANSSKLYRKNLPHLSPTTIFCSSEGVKLCFHVGFTILLLTKLCVLYRTLPFSDDSLIQLERDYVITRSME